MEGTAGDALLFSGRAVFFDKAVFRQLLLNLCQIFFLQRDIKGGADGLQMPDLPFCLLRELFKRFKGAFELVILIKIFLGIFPGV